MKKFLKNRHAVLLLLVITGFMFVLIGGSYAYFGAVASSEEQVVTSGSLELVYHTGQDIVIDHALPTEEENASVHTFTVENIGMKSVEYNISFVDIMLTKDGENTFSPNLKWALYSSDEDYNNQVLIKNGSFSSISGYLSGDNEFVIKTKLPLDVGMKNSYVLKVWLQETGKVQNKDINMDLSLKVQVDDLQREEAVGKKSVLKEHAFADISGISKIVFQNKIEPVSGAEEYDLSSEQDGNCMAYLVDNVLYVQGNDEIYLSDGWSLFENLSVESLENMKYVNTSEVTDMSSMFLNCSKLAELDLSNFDTSQVTDMYGVFSGCSGLTSLDLSSFDTSQVTNMRGMFENCSNLTNLDLTTFNTSNVMNMENMFYGCSNLVSLDVSNFNTSKVMNMSSMFQGCSRLSNLEVSHFSSPSWASGMFSGCSSLTSLDLRNFRSVQESMFYGCSSLKSLDLRNVVSGDGMEIFTGINPDVNIFVKDETAVDMINELLAFSGASANVFIADEGNM